MDPNGVAPAPSKRSLQKLSGASGGGGSARAPASASTWGVVVAATVSVTSSMSERAVGGCDFLIIIVHGDDLGTNPGSPRRRCVRARRAPGRVSSQCVAAATTPAHLRGRLVHHLPAPGRLPRAHTPHPRVPLHPATRAAQHGAQSLLAPPHVPWRRRRRARRLARHPRHVADRSRHDDPRRSGPPRPADAHPLPGLAARFNINIPSKTCA